MAHGFKNEIKLLENVIRNAEFGKSFLITGHEMIGKKTMVMSLAQSLIGKDILEPGDLSIIEVGPDKRAISIGAIRDLKNSANIASPVGKIKIVIIDNAHRMTTEAQNAFLKLAEEPNKNLFIILVTHAPNLLLGTIRSRTFLINCNPPDNNETQEYLVSKDISKAQKEYLQGIFSGRIGIIDRIINNSEEFKKALNLLKDYLAVSAGERLILNQQLSTLALDINTILYIWILILKSQNINANILKSVNSAYQELQYESAVPKLILDKLAISI